LLALQDEALYVGRAMCTRMKQLLDRQQFEVVIQVSSCITCVCHPREQLLCPCGSAWAQRDAIGNVLTIGHPHVHLRRLVALLQHSRMLGTPVHMCTQGGTWLCYVCMLCGSAACACCVALLHQLSQMLGMHVKYLQHKCAQGALAAAPELHDHKPCDCLKLQAMVSGKVIARETLRALRSVQPSLHQRSLSATWKWYG